MTSPYRSAPPEDPEMPPDPPPPMPPALAAMFAPVGGDPLRPLCNGHPHDQRLDMARLPDGRRLSVQVLLQRRRSWP